MTNPGELQDPNPADVPLSKDTAEVFAALQQGVISALSSDFATTLDVFPEEQGINEEIGSGRRYLARVAIMRYGPEDEEFRGEPGYNSDGWMFQAGIVARLGLEGDDPDSIAPVTEPGEKFAFGDGVELLLLDHSRHNLGLRWCSYQNAERGFTGGGTQEGFKSSGEPAGPFLTRALGVDYGLESGAELDIRGMNEFEEFHVLAAAVAFGQADLEAQANLERIAANSGHIQLLSQDVMTVQRTAPRMNAVIKAAMTAPDLRDYLAQLQWEYAPGAE